MTSYFDKASSDVRHIPRDLTDEQFLARVAAIEAPIAHDVSLCTGDREFPNDLREKIQGIIATKAVYQRVRELKPTIAAVEHVLTMRYSEMIEDLHSAFHTLASRRVKTRFGHWYDSPKANLVARDDHDSGGSS